jgi:hypothetical protein
MSRLHTASFGRSTGSDIRKPLVAGVLQRKCACGQHTSGGQQCEECKKKGMTLQRQSNSSAMANPVPPVVHDVLNSPGQPLDASARAFLEPRFEHDFSNVRVHTDETAAASAKAFNAAAYTVGRDLVFAAGQYSPATSEGRKLVAHELTHVLQQSAQPSKNGSLAHAETEADLNAAAAVNAQATTVQLGVGPGSLQRKESGESSEPPGSQTAKALEGDWQGFFDLALQGTAGIDISAAQKAELAAKIADEAILLLAVRAQVEKAKGVDFPERDWMNHFKGALQTTSAGTYKKKKSLDGAAKKAVTQAAEIADAAIRVSREGRNRLEKLFTTRPLPADQPKKPDAPKQAEAPRKTEES